MNIEMLKELKNKLGLLDSKRIASAALATMLATTPMMAKGETPQDSRDEGKKIEETNYKVYNFDLGDFLPVSQEKKVNEFDVEKYIYGLKDVASYLCKYLTVNTEEEYNELIIEIQCLYFLINRDYMSEDVEKELVNGVNINGTVYKLLNHTNTSLDNGLGKLNFELANKLIDRINEYNDGMIIQTDNRDALINMSKLCYNENDRKLTESMFEHWFMAHHNNTFDKKVFFELFKELTTLNAEENLVNADSLSVGKKWSDLKIIGESAMQTIRDYLRKNYANELEKYFTKESLQEKVWVIKDDIYLNLQCLSDLEYYVSLYGQLWEFCIKNVDKDILKSFQRSSDMADDNKISIRYSEQKQMSVEEFFNEVKQINAYLKKYLKNYDSEMQKLLLQQVECLHFITNAEYAKDIEEELINGVSINGEKLYPIFRTDMYKIDDMSGIQNFMYANYFLNIAGDYNQSVVRKTNDFDKIIDLSVFAHNEEEQKVVHELMKEWFESHKNDTFNKEIFTKAFKTIINLDNELTFGVEWLVKLGIGSDMLQVLRDYMRDNYSVKELSKYFVLSDLNREQWTLKDNLDLNPNSSNELEVLAYQFRELRITCLDNVNDEIFTYFNGNCPTYTK